MFYRLYKHSIDDRQQNVRSLGLDWERDKVLEDEEVKSEIATEKSETFDRQRSIRGQLFWLLNGMFIDFVARFELSEIVCLYCSSLDTNSK